MFLDLSFLCSVLMFHVDLSSFGFLYLFVSLSVGGYAQEAGSIPNNTGSSPAPVNLGVASEFAILANTGISTLSESRVFGNLGVNSVDLGAITGFLLIPDVTNLFNTSAQVTGKVYVASDVLPTPTKLMMAMSSMDAAYDDAQGRPADFIDLTQGSIGGLTLTYGVYQWTTDLLIASSVTLSGTNTDVWVFQVANNLIMNNATRIILLDGAKADNIFWQVAGTVDIGTDTHFEGVVLASGEITTQVGSVVSGGLFSKTTLNMDGTTVIKTYPTGVSVYGVGTPGCYGSLGMNASEPTRFNSPDFALLCTNAPCFTLGLGIITDSQDAAGSKLFDLEVLFHIDLELATQMVLYDFVSDSAGLGIAPIDIPNSAALLGLTFYGQCLWFESTQQHCSPSPIGLVSSNGIKITVLGEEPLPTPPGLSFYWVVDNIPKFPPEFTISPGPPGGSRNFVSRLQLTHELALVLYQRVSPDSAVSLLEAVIWNDPLICEVQPGPGLPIPSQTLPNVDLVISGARMYPIFPALSTWKSVDPGTKYHLQLTNPDWSKIADGAGYAWPFLVTTDPVVDPNVTDIVPLFPPNPGSIWSSVDPNFPSHTSAEIAELSTGGAYFPATGDPWAVMGQDVQYTQSTGYQPDWFWCHLGAYYARDDITDILFILPTVYRQAARPCHFFGLDGASGSIWFNMSRPATWSTDYLGRVPVISNTLLTAPVEDSHGWYGYDHQHASTRRVAEYAMATGSPFACSLVLYYGELAKVMMRSIDPQPYGGGFDNSPRGYLGWLEIAYRAQLLDSSYDMTICVKSMSDFFKFCHDQPYGVDSGTPQVMWAQVNDKWIPDHYAAASFEDLRAVPILIKVGQQFHQNTFLSKALDVCEWYTTAGYTNGEEGKGVGIKRLVDPLDPSIFVEADLSGYNRVAALGLKMAGEYLQLYPKPGFNGFLYTSISGLIVADSKTQSDWVLNLASWMSW